jgi:hypothetical protein
LWAYYTPKTVRVVCSSDAVSAYVWRRKSKEFFHCKTCGCLTHYESIKKNRDGKIAVNARMMAPDAIASIRVRRLDGASTWKYFD